MERAIDRWKTWTLYPCGSGEKGGGEMGNGVATCGTKPGTTGGIRTNPDMGSDFSQLQRIPGTPEIAPGRGKRVS